MDNSVASSSSRTENDSLGWMLDLDLTIGDERNMRDAQLLKGENINLVLELRNESDGTWPRAMKTNNTLVGAPESEAASDELTLGDGIVGLYNMGNTCYLNSTIQVSLFTFVFCDFVSSVDAHSPLLLLLKIFFPTHLPVLESHSNLKRLFHLKGLPS